MGIGKTIASGATKSAKTVANIKKTQIAKTIAEKSKISLDEVAQQLSRISKETGRDVDDIGQEISQNIDKSAKVKTDIPVVKPSKDLTLPNEYQLKQPRKKIELEKTPEPGDITKPTFEPQEKYTDFSPQQQVGLSLQYGLAPYTSTPQLKADSPVWDILHNFPKPPVNPIKLTRGRPPKSTGYNPNELDFGKPTKNDLELGGGQTSSVPLNEYDLPIDSKNIEIDNAKSLSKLTDSPASEGLVPSSNIASDASNLPIQRTSTIPKTVDPEVIGKGVRKTAEEADIPDAEIIDKINKMPAGPLKDIALKKYAIGLLAAGVGVGVLNRDGGDGGDNESNPSISFSPQKINNPQDVLNNKNQEVLSDFSDKKSISTDGSDQLGLSKELEDLSKKQKTENDKLNYMQLMLGAEESANKNKLAAALLKAGMQAGAAIAGPGVKVDTSLADTLSQAADQPVLNIQRLMQTEVASKKLKELEREEREGAELRDPKSARSIAARKQWSALLPGITEDMSAQDIKDQRDDRIRLLISQRDAAARAEQNAKTEREREIARLDKRKLITEEIETYRRNIKSNLLRAKEILDQAGTFEMFGSESGELDTLMDQISSDMAKLQDPGSIARPSEVGLVRKNLVPEGILGKLGTRNSTALSLLNAFEKTVDQKADTGYAVRGIDLPKDNKSNQLTTPSAEMNDETREKVIKYVMDKNKVSRDVAIDALIKAEKIK